MRVQSRGVRVVRGGVVASSSVAIAAFSHVAGGGAQPGLLGVVLALAFSSLASIALAGRSLSTVRLAVSVALSQFVFHVLFSLGASLPTAASGTQPVGMLGMVMSGGARTTLPDLSSSHGVAVMEMSDARMWVGHAVAAILTIALLRDGERSFWTLVRLGSARLRRLVAVVDALPSALGLARHRRSAAIADRRGIRPPLDVLLTTRPHRGPPVSV